MEIKKLDYVNIRDIWKNEATNFTTWLEKNIILLNEILPFKINNVEREQSVGTFSVDLKGIDENGDLVIIENQFGKTDHDHLGKIVTYFSNLDAKTAIWICEDPRPEHKEAIDWLNKFTGFNFYLVRLEAVKIGDSPVAPLFSIVAGPSEEMKEAGTKSKEMSETNQKMMEFWTKLLQKIKQKNIKLHSNLTPSKYCYIQTGAGTYGLNYVYYISNKAASVYLSIDKGKESAELNKKIFQELLKHKKEIEEKFGDKLDWSSKEGVRLCFVAKTYNIGLKDVDKWDELQDKMISDMTKLESAFKEYIKNLK